MGQAPQSFAKAASERIRSGLSPNRINISAAVWAPTPKLARSVGDVSVVSRSLGEGRPPAGERPKGVFGGRGRRIEWAWTESGGVAFVRLRSRVSESWDEQSRAELPRISIPGRHHRAGRLALLSFQPEFPGRGRSSRPARGHGHLRDHSTVVPDVRPRLRPTTPAPTRPTFGRAYARRLRRRRGRMGDTWYLDEVFVAINGRQQYLWRAVDEDGDVLDILVQSRRNRRAAVRFFRKLLKHQGCVPRRLITDKLRSYPAACRTVMPSVVHCTDQYANNRAEVSHQATRQRERQMRRFKSAGHLQRFATVHGAVQNLFRVGRHLLRATHHRLLRTRAFVEWEAVTCAC